MINRIFSLWFSLMHTTLYNDRAKESQDKIAMIIILLSTRQLNLDTWIILCFIEALASVACMFYC